MAAPALYVHVPFCAAKCAYCAFYSRPWQKEDEVRTYLEGLAMEIDRYGEDTSTEVSSLFIGGGTPTVLSERDLHRLLDLINQGFSFSVRAEKTAEGNPGTLNEEKLNILRAQGINRLSLGVQSFSDPLLKEIGRIHTAETAGEAIGQVRRAGFTNLNLDLMFGLPGQTMADWHSTLETAVGYGPEHLSLYGLMVEQGTPLALRLERPDYRAALPDDDAQADMYAWAVDYLRHHGYDRYETSNFARPGFECRHNLSYWRGADYIGLGPGAVSFHRPVRIRNVEDIEAYRARLSKGEKPVGEREELSPADLMGERMILGLRLSQGVDLQKFARDFGADARNIYAKVLERYRHKDILRERDGFLSLNPAYAFVANAVLQDFLL